MRTTWMTQGRQSRRPDDMVFVLCQCPKSNRRAGEHPFQMAFRKEPMGCGLVRYRGISAASSQFNVQRRVVCPSFSCRRIFSACEFFESPLLVLLGHPNTAQQGGGELALVQLSHQRSCCVCLCSYCLLRMFQKCVPSLFSIGSFSATLRPTPVWFFYDLPRYCRLLLQFILFLRLLLPQRRKWLFFGCPHISLSPRHSSGSTWRAQPPMSSTCSCQAACVFSESTATGLPHIVPKAPPSHQAAASCMVPRVVSTPKPVARWLRSLNVGGTLTTAATAAP